MEPEWILEGEMEVEVAGRDGAKVAVRDVRNKLWEWVPTRWGNC